MAFPLTHRDRLIIFTRYPQPGKTKTRLIPALGAEAAAQLQRQMTEHTLAEVQQLIATRPLSVEIWFSSAEPAAGKRLMQTWLGDWVYRPQAEGGLGDRMAQALQAAFAEGMQKAVVIGTDCPGLDAQRLREAFEALDRHDLVLGTATDGGYYLIGLRRPIPELFVGIHWGTDHVFQQTIAIAERLGLSTMALEPLTDIDRPEDLPVWQAILQAKSQPPPQLSIIIPVLNEANTIESVLKAVQQDGIEVIVVDGGSQDPTPDLAQQLNAKVISAPLGRASQMNAGAAIATGKILLFLHADTQLPRGFTALIHQTLDKGAIAGAFELSIDGKTAGLRLVEWGVKWRSHFCQLPYGDQAIFLKADTFRALGGFAALPIMEDFELVQRLKRFGTVAIAPAAVITSGRRWQKLGILKTTLINQLVILGYFLKISPERIARWYRRL
ncbi:MAG TPA: TIGR04283 family arsenosugar biosynthesis glycosyltransferase [Coleofasciculaceae cyanobacterium]